MLTRRTLLAAAAAAPLGTLLARPALAMKPAVFATDGIAINGYDPVAYFTEGAPVKGEAGIFSDWEGAKLLFASAENKAMFDADPQKFTPRYGGYCAYAVSKGATAPTDPEAWTVYEDRLYLNFSVDVRSIWKEDIPGNISRADANWPGVLG
ncbi:MAG: YHS domain-containing (seleno)protein [Paracoccaceae bacterium]|nr:YHS domain-containing (seleno)protein [Paracoccaceae bacterium]